MGRVIVGLCDIRLLRLLSRANSHACRQDTVPQSPQRGSISSAVKGLGDSKIPEP